MSRYDTYYDRSVLSPSLAAGSSFKETNYPGAVVVLLEIGTRVYRRPFGCEERHAGKVVHVNNKTNYYTVEFRMPGGMVREGYRFDD